jgi:hypothetical protein
VGAMFHVTAFAKKGLKTYLVLQENLCELSDFSEIRAAGLPLSFLSRLFFSIFFLLKT